MPISFRTLHVAATAAKPLSFTDCCRTGYWFCRSCERITEPQGEIHKTCGHKHCGSARLQYCPPVSLTDYSPNS